MGVGQFEDSLDVAVLSDDIDHAAQTTWSNIAKRVPAYRANVVLELAGHRAFDGPVPRVVNPGRHLVGDQAIGCLEQLKR